MAYNYYQNTMPSYGSNQPFQFGAPPKPAFQPQPSWGGHDFYRAHAANADPYLFDHAWNRVREYGGAPAGGMGVGLHEARHWHRRAYGAMNEVHLLAPEELGHAAAYEAYRTWIHNSFMYEPLSGDIERQREALTGLAVAEASRLLTFSSRPLDNYAKMAASEAAAHTASYIFYQSREENSRSRSSYRPEYDDPYAYDDDVLYQHSRSYSRSGHRSHSRPRSHSRHRSYSQSGMMPFPGQAYSSSSVSSMPMPHTAYASQPGIYGDPYGSNQGYPMAVGMQPSMGSASAYGTPVSMGMGGAYSAMPPGVASSYQGSTLGVPGDYSRSRSSSFSYPQQPYMGTAMSASGMGMPMGTAMSAGMGMPMGTPMSAGMGMPMGTAMSASGMGMGMPQGQTIVIHKPRRSKHRHHSKHRSHSSDGDYRDSHYSERY
ncbi:hypothetical protein D9613_000567 [Agrocybe pediades]|uniref:Uncharacterized protein n=1 Tax=Agrocybe pediades TaxID=84607 RepID=A0A8H4R302_9AGAR|nr:hypothetical protein D9613_000567 [Agrocybe pediades]